MDWMTWANLSPWIAGAAGGLILALARLVVSFGHLLSEGRDAKQFLLAQWLPIIVLSLMGAAVSGFIQDVAGSFITGLTALGFVLALANTKTESSENRG